MIDMKDKFMCISIRQDGYEMFSNGGWASYNKDGKITGSCGDVDSFPAILNVSVAGKKEFDTDKTLEQRVSDLEKQLADTISPSDAASIMEIVSAETDRIIREKNMIGFSADIAFMANAKLNSEYVFIADQITPDDDDVKVNVRITGRQTPDLSLFWVPVLVDKVDGASLKYYEDQGVIAAKKMIIDISKAAAL